MPAEPRRKRRRREEPQINLTSFADIAFLLIIYFILAASLSQDLGFSTDIPAGQKAEKASDDKTITIKDEDLYWGDQKINIFELQQELINLKLPERDPNARVVQFEAKGRVIYQQYYEVLAAIDTAGGIPGIVTDSGEKKR